MGENWNDRLARACESGNKKAVELTISKGARDWNAGLSRACFAGHREIVELMVTKGTIDYNWGLASACLGGHREIVNLMISKGANNWDLALACACRCAQQEIAQQAIGSILVILLRKGATNYECLSFHNINLQTLVEDYNLPLWKVQSINPNSYAHMKRKYERIQSMIGCLIFVADLGCLVSKYLNS